MVLSLVMFFSQKRIVILNNVLFWIMHTRNLFDSHSRETTNSSSFKGERIIRSQCK